MSRSEQQIARAKKIIEQHKRRINASKLTRRDAALVNRYMFGSSKELAEEAVAYEQGRFKGDVREID